MSITEDKAMLCEMEQVLKDFAPITLEEMEADHLMSRFDGKVCVSFR